MKSKVRLLGAGRGASVLYALPGLPIANPMIKNASGDTGFDVFADYDITLEHLTFDGAGRTYFAYDQDTNPPTYGGLSQSASRGHLVRMYSVNRFSSFACEYKNHPSISPLVSAGGRDNKIIGNWFHNNGKIDDVSPCLFVSPSFPNSTPNYNCIVTNNHFYDCDRMAARFEVSGGTFSHNTIEDVGEGGIHIENGGFCTVIGNTFRNARVTDIVGNGIEIEAEDEAVDGIITISGNLFENMGTRGISLNGSQSVTVTGNVFRNCGTDVVYPTPNGPLNYAAGRSAGDTIATFRRCAMEIATADTYQSRNVIIKDNIIVDTDGVMQYGIVFAKTGTPLEKFENILIKDNIITGAVISKYYLPAAADVGANVYVEDALDSSNQLLAVPLPLNEGHVVTGSAALTTSGTARVVAFDAAATEDWQWELVPNYQWPVGKKIVGVKLYGQKSSSADSGNIVLRLGTLARIPGSNSIGTGTLNTESFTKAVTAAGSATIETHTCTFTTPVAWTAGYFMVLNLARLGADGSDTATTDYYLISAQLIFE